MNLNDFYARQNSRVKIRSFTCIIFLFTAALYFSWRINVLNHDALIFSVIFLAAEFFGCLIILLSIFITWKVKIRTPIKPNYHFTVDVFIPTYNESSKLLRTTILAAKKLKYPHTTWILDDGNREDINKLASELGCKYITRDNNTHAKAGNLNNALKHSSAELIAIFDADHVPKENFLDQLIGYFNNEKVAFVQTPQDFYNTDSFQFSNHEAKGLLWHDQTFFYQIGQAGRDYWNAASFCGTNAIIRRSSLDSINGFATETVTEDMHTSIRLQKLGYESVYHPEPLAYGVAATNYTEFLQQRLRWARGNIQSLFEEKLPFCRGLNTAQKICYTSLGISYFEGLSRCILYFTPAIVLLTGIAPIGETESFFKYFIPYFLFSWLCIEEFGRGSTRFLKSEYMSMARFPVYFIASISLFLKRKKWRITSKEYKKNTSAIYIFPQLLVLIFNFVALIQGIIAPPHNLILNMSEITIWVICFWAFFNITLATLVILNVMKIDLLNSLRKENSFIIKLNIELFNNNKTIYANTVSVSDKQITFNKPENKSFKVGDCYNCKIISPEFNIDCKINIIKIDDLIQCEILNIDDKSREILNLKLRQCSWYRKPILNRGFFETPIEILQNIFKMNNS